MKNNKLKALVAKTVEEIIDLDMYEWPPGCAYLLFQPKRPITCSDTSLIDQYHDDV